MTWVYALFFLVLAFVLLRVLLKWPDKTISWYEFEHWVHSFAKIKKEGGVMTFSHSQSPVFLRFRRGSGKDAKCELFLDVPRTRWSEPMLDALQKTLDAKGVSATAASDNIGVLLRVRLQIADIWKDASGASGARLAQDLFRVWGLDEKARFKLVMKGENSLRTWEPTATRWATEENPVLRHIGRKISETVDHEIESENKKEARNGKK